MHTFARPINETNVDKLLLEYVAAAERVGESISGLNCLRLLEALKRHAVGAGPYPDVTLFEAANRIMTDLVIHYGVLWLLKENIFPFRSCTVEYGHENKNAHDIMPEDDGRRLIDEVFNVAPSFFYGKKN